MKFLGTYPAPGQGKCIDGFFKKLFSYLFQRQALSAGLGNQAGLGLGVEFNPNGQWNETLGSTKN